MQQVRGALASYRSRNNREHHRSRGSSAGRNLDTARCASAHDFQLTRRRTNSRVALLTHRAFLYEFTVSVERATLLRVPTAAHARYPSTTRREGGRYFR